MDGGANFEHHRTDLSAVIGDENAWLRSRLSPDGMEQRMIQRRPRIKHQKTFEERLAEEAARYKEAADLLPPGPEREQYLKRARQAETASHINEWLASPGLQPPKEVRNLSSRRE